MASSASRNHSGASCGAAPGIARAVRRPRPSTSVGTSAHTVLPPFGMRDDAPRGRHLVDQPQPPAAGVGAVDQVRRAGAVVVDLEAQHRVAPAEPQPHLVGRVLDGVAGQLGGDQLEVAGPVDPQLGGHRQDLVAGPADALDARGQDQLVERIVSAHRSTFPDTRRTVAGYRPAATVAPRVALHPAARSGGRLPHHPAGVLVDPQPDVGGVAQDVATRPLAEADLDHELGLDPVREPGHRSRRRRIERRGLALRARPAPPAAPRAHRRRSRCRPGRRSAGLRACGSRRAARRTSSSARPRPAANRRPPAPGAGAP